MNDSSVQQDYLTISNSGCVSGTIGIIAQDIGNITIPSGGYSSGSSDTITISNFGSNYTIGSGIGGAGTGYEWNFPQEWEGCFPDWSRVQYMCEQYPALKIAFEKFKTTYHLVQDHYDTPEDQRPIP